MTTAVCIQCGGIKFGAVTKCTECGFVPQTDDEIIRSIAHTDHYFKKADLLSISARIASGKGVEVDESFYNHLRPALAELRGKHDPRLIPVERRTRAQKLYLAVLALLRGRRLPVQRPGRH